MWHHNYKGGSHILQLDSEVKAIKCGEVASIRYAAVIKQDGYNQPEIIKVVTAAPKNVAAGPAFVTIVPIVGVCFGRGNVAAATQIGD